MSQEQKIQSCPVCYEINIATVKNSQNELMLLYKCERCGEYYIDRVLVGLPKSAWYDIKHLASAWIKRENKNGIIPTFGNGATGFEDINSSEWWTKQFQYLGLPETTNEKMNELLNLFGRKIDGRYNGRVAPNIEYVSEIGARDIEEIQGLTKLLSQAGYLIPFGTTGTYYISVNGWLHIDDLRNTINSSNSAFIAMWFANDTKLYRDSVVAAVSFCGYKPIIIDQQEYNDFIMNQVISSIKQSKFLVADFTSRPEVENDGKVKNGVRGGVYWEAGMAYGLGKPVIHTCEDNIDAINRIHFDVNQYNTIFWKTEELGTDIRPIEQNNPNPNFAEKLAARILATVGKGTYIKD